jgi:hypothetical protein
MMTIERDAALARPAPGEVPVTAVLDEPGFPDPVLATDPTALVGIDDADESDEGDDTGRLVRPYAITRGRTGVEGAELHLESQLQASSRAADQADRHRWEAARVLELVQSPMALVEVAARLELPIGVTRVIVADLVRDGSVIVHVPESTNSFTSLLEKVLDGVRNL